jgi:predicted DCC family thiol-disulfide oxidoreductase YuxK
VTPGPPRAALLYDADCGFCLWCLHKVLAADRHHRLRPVALQDPEADALLGGMDEERKMDSWHLVTPDGSVYSAGAATGPLLRLLPRGGVPARIPERFPGATERVYRWLAGHRSLLGRALSRKS